MTPFRPLDVATWNIGGGILGASHQEGGVPSLTYHIGMLKTHRPDVVFLQESHEYDDRMSQTQELAERTGYDHCVSFAMSSSHLVDGADLALGVLSRYPLLGVSFRPLPAPWLESTGPNGEHWILHDKGYLVGGIEVPGGAVHFANAHFFPLHRFGRSAADAQFASQWRSFTDDLLEIGAAGPALAGFDLNHFPVEEVLGDALVPGRFTNALKEGTPTTPRGVQRDYLLCGGQVHILSARALPTRSDHFLCQATVLV